MDLSKNNPVRGISLSVGVRNARATTDEDVRRTRLAVWSMIVLCVLCVGQSLAADGRSIAPSQFEVPAETPNWQSTEENAGQTPNLLPQESGSMAAVMPEAEPRAMSGQPLWNSNEESQQQGFSRSGFIGQGGVLGLKSFGRSGTITPLEALPYVLLDDHLFFADLRGFGASQDKLGGNAGLGYRFIDWETDAWYGASVWYDADSTQGKQLQQVGLSLEALIENWEFRSNLYHPIKNKTQVLSSTITGSRFFGNQLIFSELQNQRTALRGVDYEVGRSLSWSDELQFRGFVGGYNFDRGVNGFKARAEVVYNQAITTQLLYTRDKLFGSNLMVGCQLQLSGHSSHPSETWSGTPSPFRFVERNYNVIAKTGVKAVDTVAINPLTGKPYVIQHVGLLPLAGPLHSQSNIVNAQAAGADVIYVQANWVLSEKATLTNGQKLIGASNNGTLQVADGRYVPLPSLPVGAQSPRFENITGTAVTLASNTEVAGFTFKNITGNAINASANSNLSIHDLSFQQIQGDAVSLAYSANEFLYNLNFQQVQGNAVYLLDPRGSVGIDNLQMSNVGQGVRVGVFTPAVFPLPASPNPGPRNLAMSNVTIDQAATGVTFANYGGASYFDKISLKNVTTGLTFNGVANARINDLTVSTAQSGVDIQNGRQGDLIRFSGTTSLTTTGTYGLQVANNASEVVVDNLLVNETANGLVPSAAVMLSNDTGAVTLGNVSLDATNAIGIKADAVSLLKINGGVITSTNAPALNITNSALNASLGQVSTTGGAVGINLLNDTGSLTVTGFGSVGSGGTIQNTTTGIVQTGDISTSFNRMVLLNNGTGIQSTGARQLQVGNSLITGSTGYAIDSLNDKLLSLQSSTLLNNASTVRMQANQAGTYNAEIVSNTIVDNKGTPLLFKNGSTSATFSGNFQGNDITATHAGVASIDLDWNGPVGLTVASNQFKGTGGGNFGLKVNGTATTTANVYNNSFTFNGGGGSGIALTSAGTSTLQIQSNTIDFRSGNLGIGMRLNLQAATQTEISSNLITDRGGGGSGIIVDHAAANSKFKVDGNVINLSTIDIVGPIIDPVTFRKGIQFATVDTPIQLSGTRDNIVTNSIQPFYIPINTSTGSILVNGVAKP